jgi:plastocyanin
MRHSIRVLAACVSLLALWGLTACGGNDSGSSAGDGSCRTITVDIGAFVFKPTPVKVHACDKVVWKNAHDQAHTSTGDGDQAWDTGNVEPGKASKPVTFAKAGTFTYTCALHPFMHGEVDVS